VDCYAEALNEAIREEMRRDSTVFVMGEDVLAGARVACSASRRGSSKSSVSTRPRYTHLRGGDRRGRGRLPQPQAVGLCDLYVDFIGLAMEPIVNQAPTAHHAAAKPASRWSSGSGRRPARQCPQHSQSLEAWFCHIPGLKVVTRSTPRTQGSAQDGDPGRQPVIFLEHKVLYFQGAVDERLHRALQCRRGGREGRHRRRHHMVGKALQAAELLAEEGIELEVIDPRTLVPLDEQTIVDSVKTTGRLIVSHEAYTRGGYGAEIISRVVEAACDYLDAPPLRVCARDVPVPYNATLETAALPQVDDLVAAARALMNKER
jgi:pyruvate dehydrogenase E1 component beta subunit